MLRRCASTMSMNVRLPTMRSWMSRERELLVLEHGMQKLADAVVIEAEVEFVELYRGQPLFGDIETLCGLMGLFCTR